MKACRGATSLKRDDAQHLAERVCELVNTWMERNQLVERDIVSIYFSATPDIRSDFPARIVRTKIFDVPMLDLQHMDVDRAFPRIIRMLAYVDIVASSEIYPVYLHEATSLRSDLN